MAAYGMGLSRFAFARFRVDGLSIKRANTQTNQRATGPAGKRIILFAVQQENEQAVLPATLTTEKQTNEQPINRPKVIL